MQIPKFIKNIKKYFMYEGSATPTTQDDLQAYMKNEHETLECLVDGLWQPETEYQEGHVVRSPNMLKGIEARVKTGGYSATNEPDWKVSATEISDGSVVWEKIARFNNIEVTGDVTGSGAVDNGGQVMLNLELPDKVTAGTVGDTAAANLGNGATFTVPYLTVDEKGRVTDYDKRDLTLPTITTFGTGSSISVTGSTEGNWSSQLRHGESGYSDNLSGATLTRIAGIAAGTYTLQNLLQGLVSKSHTHGSVNVYSNCNCNCSDSDGSCIIEGNILTAGGAKPIECLAIGDFILGDGFRFHKVVGIKKSSLGNRKAIKLKNTGVILTDDHLIWGNDDKYYAYDVNGYHLEASRSLTDGYVYGTYARQDDKVVHPLTEGIKIVEMPGGTITYTPIVENCEWCMVGLDIVACARHIK